MNIIVIGGGAAGLMAAGTAAEQGAQVTLLETNEKVGRKLFITGKGRCNVCNNCDVQEVLRNVPVNPRFLYSALGGFGPADVMDFFENHGVALKTERGNRVFPQSDKAADIIDALFLWVKKAGVTIVHTTADELLIEDGVLTGVSAGHKTYKADRIIVATGGASYPQTGSTGDGYRMAQALGHMIVPPRGSLVPLESDSPDCAAMQGLALRNVELAVYSKKTKPLFREFGEMLFTHFGVSGPLVLSASAHLRNWDKERYRLVIDLKPALDEQKLESRILRDIAENPNRDMDKILSGLVPRSMVPVVLRRCGLPPEEKANSLTREQRRALVQLLTHFEIPVTGPRPVREAIITSGGVKVGEVQPATMESKLVRGLFFAGEILDTDAYTGGFNLQIAWATGHCAGCAAAEYKEMQQ